MEAPTDEPSTANKNGRLLGPAMDYYATRWLQGTTKDYDGLLGTTMDIGLRGNTRTANATRDYEGLREITTYNSSGVKGLQLRNAGATRNYKGPREINTHYYHDSWFGFSKVML